MTARGVAIVCGVLLGGFGVLGLLVTPGAPSETNFLLASWLLPITLFPAAALAVALDPDISREVSGQAVTLWPAHLGLALYGFVTGPRWLAAASGGALALFPKTRPAGFQIWLAYPVLLGSWGLKCLLL